MVRADSDRRISQEGGNPMPHISRRQLLRRLAALACGAASLDVLAACTSAPAPGALSGPVDTVAAPTETVAPSAKPTSTPPERTATPKPEIVRAYPDGPSTTVHTRHSGVWDGDALVPGALRQMLDASITALTGLSDARTAWAALFRPHERIAIKVNVFRNSLVWTHLALVDALAGSLQEAGIPGEQIVVYDHLTSEFETAGYPVNEGGPGMQCYGSDSRHTGGWTVAGKPVSLSNALLECDALINVPVLKRHAMSGLSFALKNHFGTVSSPESLHSPLDRCIAELNAVPAIRDRTRLIIGDALGICLQTEAAWPFWREEVPGDSLLLSYDPVAVDTLGLKLFSEALAASGGNPVPVQGRSAGWLAIAAELGLGTNDEANMDLVEVALE
jgi:hypothetical protein